MTESNFEECHNLLQQAIQIEPNNTEVMDFFGELFFETGDFERAQQVIYTIIKNSI